MSPDIAATPLRHSFTLAGPAPFPPSVPAMGQSRRLALGSSSQCRLLPILLLWLLSLILAAVPGVCGATRSGGPLSHNKQLSNHINHIASPRHFHNSNHIPDSSKDEAAAAAAAAGIVANKSPPSQQLPQLHQQHHNHHLHTSSTAVNGTAASVVSSPSSSLQASSHSHHHQHPPLPNLRPDGTAPAPDLPFVPEVLEEKVYHNGGKKRITCSCIFFFVVVIMRHAEKFPMTS